MIQRIGLVFAAGRSGISSAAIVPLGPDAPSITLRGCPPFDGPFRTRKNLCGRLPTGSQSALSRTPASPRHPRPGSS